MYLFIIKESSFFGGCNMLSNDVGIKRVIDDTAEYIGVLIIVEYRESNQ